MSLEKNKNGDSCLAMLLDKLFLQFLFLKNKGKRQRLSVILYY